MKVKDLEFDFDDLIDAAETEANTEWEMEFVADIRDKYDNYGDNMFISEAQIEVLERISE